MKSWATATGRNWGRAVGEGRALMDNIVDLVVTMRMN